MSKLTDRLTNALGIRNAYEFARYAQAVAWIGYSHSHPHAFNYASRRATVHFTKDGNRFKREFREQGKTAHEDRRLSIEAAQAYASARFGVTEWVVTPFRDSWVPREAYNRVMADLKAAEAAAKTTAETER